MERSTPATEIVRTRDGSEWSRVGPVTAIGPAARAGRVRNADRDALLVELADGALAGALHADADARGDHVLASFARGRLASADGPATYRDATGDGPAYALLPWLEGGTLAAALGRARAGASVDSAIVATLAAELAAGLTITAALGALVPAAIVIDDTGRARVRGPLVHALARADAPTAALPYTAPELVRGEPPRAAARVFALGAMLHDLLAGAPLFPDGAAAARAIARYDGPSSARLPPAPSGLREALHLMLQPDPHRRGSAHAIVDLLAPLHMPITEVADVLLGTTRTPVPYFG